MKNIKIVLVIFLLLVVYNTSFGGGLDLEGETIDPKLVGIDTSDLPSVIENMVAYVVGLLYLISVILGLYGGFMILTSAGDDDRVKKGKTIIIFVVIGLIVIFLTSTLVSWIVDVMKSNDISDGT